MKPNNRRRPVIADSAVKIGPPQFDPSA